MDFLTASTTQSLTLRVPELHSELGLKGLFFDCNAILRKSTEIHYFVCFFNTHKEKIAMVKCRCIHFASLTYS